MPSKHLILCHPLLLLPPTFPSIRVFSNESALCIRWPKYWSFSISPSSEYSGMISFRIDWSDLLAVQGALKSLLQSSLRECGCAPALRRVRECGCALARHRVPAGSLNFAPGKKKKESSPAPQFESINSSVLNLPYGPALTSVRDYWKNHSFDYVDLCWKTAEDKSQPPRIL